MKESTCAPLSALATVRQILASGPGVVIHAGPEGGWGNSVVIDHGNQITTRYAHMSAIQARVGDEVFAGEQIGLVGETGFAKGAHLHFEVRDNGDSRNPQEFLS